MSVLSPSTVAISLSNPARIDIWDWKLGKVVQTVAGFNGKDVAHALLPDGRLATGDSAGVIRVGSLANWTAALSRTPKVPAIISILALQDGSFVGADQAGGIHLWNGKREITLTGGPTSYCVAPLARVGGRLVVAGGTNAILVSQ